MACRWGRSAGQSSEMLLIPAVGNEEAGRAAGTSIGMGITGALERDIPAKTSGPWKFSSGWR